MVLMGFLPVNKTRLELCGVNWVALGTTKQEMPDVGARPTPWRADDVEASLVPQMPDRRRPLESLVEQHKPQPDPARLHRTTSVLVVTDATNLIAYLRVIGGLLNLLV
jgi:hypothetical protein